jgi:hypothetical protein
MTLDQIANSLPNGFHDTELSGVSINYVDRTAHLDLVIWTGGPTEETYRSASLDLEGLEYWTIQPPDPREAHAIGHHLTIDIGRVTDLERTPEVQLPPLPMGVFAYWLYVREWNAFMYFAARSAAFQWRGIEETRVP